MCITATTNGLTKYVGALLLTISLAACGGGERGTEPSPSVMPTTATPTPSTAPTYYALGDSITNGLYATNVQTEAYPVVLANALGYNLTNLGIPGETSSGIVADEVNKLPPQVDVITLFIGTNDELSYIDNGADPKQMEFTFLFNLQQITSILRANYRTTNVYVANLPDPAYMPQWAGADLATRQAYWQVNRVMNNAIAQMGYSVVDLRCAPGVYDPANYYNNGIGPLGDVHPNTQGHAYYADVFKRTITGSLAVDNACQYALKPTS